MSCVLCCGGGLPQIRTGGKATTRLVNFPPCREIGNKEEMKWEEVEGHNFILIA